MSSSTTTSRIDSSSSSRNTPRLTATSSEQISLAFIKRVLTRKAIWTHKVRNIDLKSYFINIDFIFQGRIS